LIAKYANSLIKFSTLLNCLLEARLRNQWMIIDLVQALTEVIKDDEKQIEELKQRLEFITERRDRNNNLLNSILKIEELNSSQNGGEELWIESHQSKPNPDSNCRTNQNTIDSIRKSNSHSGDIIGSERVHSIVDIRTEKITRSRSSKKQLQKSNKKVVLPLSSLVNDLKNIPSASQAGPNQGEQK
jgi:hypothetical protein